jgi:hypothetical protein
VNEHARMLDGAKPPETAQVKDWIGARASVYWDALIEFIDSQYPGVFKQDWWFGGKKWGWSLRYKKSKSFCNLIPEKGQFKFLLVFGAEERKKVEEILPKLSSHVRADYENATTFHDGKWVASVVDSKKVVADIERLLVLKRKSKAGETSGQK